MELGLNPRSQASEQVFHSALPWGHTQCSLSQVCFLFSQHPCTRSCCSHPLFHCPGHPARVQSLTTVQSTLRGSHGISEECSALGQKTSSPVCCFGDAREHRSTCLIGCQGPLCASLTFLQLPEQACDCLLNERI